MPVPPAPGAVTAMIAATSAAAWQEQMQASGLTSDEAASLYATIERAVFVATANPFPGASYLDVAQQVPGWDTIFTEAFTAALLALCLLGVVAAVVTALGLRRLPHIRADEGAS